MRRKKTTEQFIEEARLAERRIEMLEGYKGVKAHHKFRCLKCGGEWTSTPDSVLHRNSGCPRCKSVNEILEDHGDWLLIDISTPTHPNATMSVDTEDWERYLAEGGGRVFADKCESSYIYAISRWGDGNKVRSFHIFVIGKRDGFEIDHKRHGDMEYIDNRKANLHFVTRRENMQNCSLNGRNKTGIAGVHWRECCGKYQAGITDPKSGKRIYLGHFDDFFEACCARKSAENKYYTNAYSKNNA